MEDDRSPQRRQDAAAIAASGRRETGNAGVEGGVTAASKAVGAMFRTARQLQRLSQQEVATRTEGRPGKVSRTAVSDIERGRNLPKLETLVSLSQVLHIDPVEVLERVGLSAAAPVDLTDWPIDKMRGRAEDLFWSGSYRDALAVYDAMLERLALAPPEDGAERKYLHARIEINRAVTLRQCSALKASKASIERAIEIAEGRRNLQAEAYTVLASLHAHEGHFVLALVAADRAVDVAERDDAKVQTVVWNQKGNVLHRAGRFDEARHAFLHARKFAIEIDSHHDMISTEGNIGACLMGLGSPTQARRRFVAAVELARKYADPAAEAFWLVELGRAVLDDGQPDDADRYARAALRIAQPADRVLTIFRAEWLRHLVARARTSDARDTARLAYLKKLYARVKEHRGLEVVKEFEEAVLYADAGGRIGGPHA